MKKFLFSAFGIFAAALAAAAPQAVVFDWGNVLAQNDRNVVVQFLCNSLQLTEAEFETANLEKREAMKAGKSDVDFWKEFAQKKGLPLTADWPENYQEVLKASIGADPEMFTIVNELKGQNIQTGILSNIDSRYTKLIRDFGFYDPFEPCLLSCEIGINKPNPAAYQALLSALPVPPEQIVFIDDKEENTEAAKKLGIDAILFSSPSQIRQELNSRGLLKN